MKLAGHSSHSFTPPGLRDEVGVAPTSGAQPPVRDFWIRKSVTCSIRSLVPASDPDVK